MNKLMLFFLLANVATVLQAQKKIRQGVNPQSPAAIICKCDNDKAFANIWKDPKSTNFILELQLSFNQSNNCPYKLDSIYLFKPGTSALPRERYYEFSEFTKLYEGTSSDKNTFRVQYSIPSKVFIPPMAINTDIATYISLRYGGFRCRIYKVFKVTEALL